LRWPTKGRTFADTWKRFAPRAQSESPMSKCYPPVATADRRAFVLGLGSALALGACGGAAAHAKAPGEASEEAEVTPGEDLMQEHGVLQRVVLMYDEAARRIEVHEALDASVVAAAAGIIRSFVEDYHERTEEKHVFPRLEAAKRETALVALLRRQHQRGRELTDEIVRAAQSPASPRLAELLRAFTRMYRPHAAREDTVLFPAFRSVVGASAYRELGEKFEDEEHARFGEHGYEKVVAEVATLEARLGIGDLAAFTAP